MQWNEKEKRGKTATGAFSCFLRHTERDGAQEGGN